MTVASWITPAARRVSLGLVALGLGSAVGIAQPVGSHIAPAITRTGQNLGQERPSTRLVLTAWLNMHNRAELDARVKDLYTPGSASFHKWLTDEDIKAYAPTAAEIEAVKAELKAHNLVVESVDPMNLSVRFSGATSNVEGAFRTQINRYSVQGKLVRTSSSLPQLSGGAAGLIHHVGGLNSVGPRPYIRFPINPKTGRQLDGVPVAQAKANGVVFASDCFYAPSTISLSGVSATDGKTPVSSTFSGLTYGANPANTARGTLAPCGYSPAEVRKFYGMDTAYGLGYLGTGQTIVIIDAYLEPNALPDLNTFNTLYHLPKVTATSFKLYNPYGANQSGVGSGWDGETDLDVEWSHAIAPGANIALVQSFDSADEDLQAATLYAITNHLGNIISGSFGGPEFFTGPFVADIWNQIIEIGAAQGVSLHFSSGDSGDFTFSGTPAADVSVPADSPYATAIGGTSIGTSPVDGTVYTTGWGNNIGFLSFDAMTLYDPPFTEFYAGSGGGTSTFFSKPGFQSKLPGTQRLLPDVSALADPFTGAEFVYTDPLSGDQYVGTVGGTSLSTPIFSGIWAVTDEIAGGSLGQAAPWVANAPSVAITDVLPITGVANVTGKISDPTGTTSYSAVDLSAPLFTTTQFVSSLYAVGGGEYVNLTFGTDSSLNVTQGWDNVTGFGTPNVGAALIAAGVGPKQ